MARIRAGYIPVQIGKNRFVVHHPSLDVSLQAQEEYVKAYEFAVDEDLLTDQDILNFLITQGIWSEQKEKEYKEIVPKHIEYWKVELYKSVLKSKTRDTVRKYLETAKEEYVRLHNIRNHYNYTTVDGYANYVKNCFLISMCTFLNDELVDWTQYDLSLIMRYYHEELLGADDIRELARTSPWNTLWNVLKVGGNVFGENITSEQQALLSWSVMYDRIQESPDCPNDEVIQDDDMLDGWLLLQKQKREAEKNKQELESAVNSKIQNADEVFIPVETASDAQKIDLLNAPQINKIKQQRIQQVKKQGVVKQQEFKDVQQKRSMQMQQAFNKQMRRK